MKKIDVNGINETDFYRDLKESCPLPEAAIYFPKESFWDPIKPRDISWNFEKFILDRKGIPLLRFLPKVEPDDIKYIVETIGKLSPDTNRSKLITDVKPHLDDIENKYKN